MRVRECQRRRRQLQRPTRCPCAASGGNNLDWQSFYSRRYDGGEWQAPWSVQRSVSIIRRRRVICITAPCPHDRQRYTHSILVWLRVQLSDTLTWQLPYKPQRRPTRFAMSPWWHTYRDTIIIYWKCELTHWYWSTNGSVHGRAGASPKISTI